MDIKNLYQSIIYLNGVYILYIHCIRKNHLSLGIKDVKRKNFPVIKQRKIGGIKIIK